MPEQTRLPDPPPPWRRALAFPCELTREISWKVLRIGIRVRGWRQSRRYPGLSLLHRAWLATDPHGRVRALESIRETLWGPEGPPLAPIPAPLDTVAHYRGLLGVRAAYRGVVLGQDENAQDIEDWLAAELGFDPDHGTERHVELTVRMLDFPDHPTRPSLER